MRYLKMVTKPYYVWAETYEKHKTLENSQKARILSDDKVYVLDINERFRTTQEGCLVYGYADDFVFSVYDREEKLQVEMEFDDILDNFSCFKETQFDRKKKTTKRKNYKSDGEEDDDYIDVGHFVNNVKKEIEEEENGRKKNKKLLSKK